MRGGTGHWHELAKLLPILSAAGFDGVLVEQEAGVERRTQNKWTVSMQASPPTDSCLIILKLGGRARPASHLIHLSGSRRPFQVVEHADADYLY